jgi:hypothetical protein
MKCPECNTKITAKHYDSSYEWYECPKCEGAFTVDELQITSDSSVSLGASATRNRSGKNVPVAKGKKRRTEIAEDKAAGDRQLEEMSTTIVATQKGATKHHDEIDSIGVVNIMADEISAIYEDLGGKLDEENARDKALILWRAVHYEANASAREREVKHVKCKAHAI